MKVQIMTEQVETRSFPARDGKAATNFREQKAAVVRDNDFPLPFKITLDDDQQPYKAGTYELCPTSLQSSKYGDFHAALPCPVHSDGQVECPQLWRARINRSRRDFDATVRLGAFKAAPALKQVGGDVAAEGALQLLQGAHFVRPLRARNSFHKSRSDR